jgi:hypothetical protein
VDLRRRIHRGSIQSTTLPSNSIHSTPCLAKAAKAEKVRTLFDKTQTKPADTQTPLRAFHSLPFPPLAASARQRIVMNFRIQSVQSGSKNSRRTLSANEINTACGSHHIERMNGTRRLTVAASVSEWTGTRRLAVAASVSEWVLRMPFDLRRLSPSTPQAAALQKRDAPDSHGDNDHLSFPSPP